MRYPLPDRAEAGCPPELRISTDPSQQQPVLADWIASDHHFHHANIVRYAGRPADHVARMVDRWLLRVRPEDTLLHLGDVLMGPRFLWDELPDLPGTVYVLDSGNHDEPHKRRYLEERWGWVFVPEFAVTYRGWTVRFSHRPIGAGDLPGDPIHPLPSKTINCHGHTHAHPEPTPQHINLCVEHTDYAPVRLQTLLDDRIDALDRAA
jgi:calcineurin-like phosphoesterase family protein